MYCFDYAERPQPDNILSFMLHELLFLGQLSCHGRKQSQIIFTIEILNKILAASTWMSNFFCKSIPASNFCHDRNSALRVSFAAHLKVCNRTVVNLYNHTLRLRYGCIPMRYSPLSVLLV